MGACRLTREVEELRSSGIASRLSPGKGIQAIRKQEGLGCKQKAAHPWNEFVIFDTSPSVAQRFVRFPARASLRLALPNRVGRAE